MPEEKQSPSEKKKEKPWIPDENQMITVQLEKEKKKQDAGSEESTKSE